MDKDRFLEVARQLSSDEIFEMAEPPGRTANMRPHYFVEVNGLATADEPSIYFYSSRDPKTLKPTAIHLIRYDEVEDIRKIK